MGDSPFNQTNFEIAVVLETAIPRAYFATTPWITLLKRPNQMAKLMGMMHTPAKSDHSATEL